MEQLIKVLKCFCHSHTNWLLLGNVFFGENFQTIRLTKIYENTRQKIDFESLFSRLWTLSGEN